MLLRTQKILTTIKGGQDRKIYTLKNNQHFMEAKIIGSYLICLVTLELLDRALSIAIKIAILIKITR